MSVVASGMSMGTRVWLAAGTTDMRKGFTGLSSGTERVGEQSVLRSCLRISRTARRFAEVVVVGRNGAVADGKALGARSVYLAAGAEWQCIAHGRATVDVARGNRLATSGTHGGSDDGDVIA